MKKYVVTTKSESGDDYIYFLKSEKELTSEDVKNYLLKNGNDFDEDTLYENIKFFKEIVEEKFNTI